MTEVKVRLHDKNPEEELGSRINPALVAATQALADGLRAVEVDDALFVLAVLLPTDSDKAGMDVVRVASNLEPEEANHLMQHIARNFAPIERATKTLSLAQAVKLVAALRAAAAAKNPNDLEH